MLKILGPENGSMSEMEACSAKVLLQRRRAHSGGGSKHPPIKPHCQDEMYCGSESA